MCVGLPQVDMPLSNKSLLNAYAKLEGLPVVGDSGFCPKNPIPYVTRNPRQGYVLVVLSCSWPVSPTVLTSMKITLNPYKPL